MNRYFRARLDDHIAKEALDMMLDDNAVKPGTWSEERIQKARRDADMARDIYLDERDHGE